MLGGYNYLKSNHHAFIEGVFKGPNVKTYEGMVRVAHSVYLLLSEYGNGVSVSYITPSEWRKIIFGKGNIKKRSVRNGLMKNGRFCWIIRNQNNHIGQML